MATYVSGLIIFLLGMLFMFNIVRVRIDYWMEKSVRINKRYAEYSDIMVQANRHIELLQDECSKRDEVIRKYELGQIVDKKA